MQGLSLKSFPQATRGLDRPEATFGDNQMSLDDGILLDGRLRIVVSPTHLDIHGKDGSAVSWFAKSK